MVGSCRNAGAASSSTARTVKENRGIVGARAAELSRADRLSEMVLSIVQVAVSLTEEWEKLESSQATRRTESDSTSRPRRPAKPRTGSHGFNLPTWSYLCSRAVNVASSWDHSLLHSRTFTNAYPYQVSIVLSIPIGVSWRCPMSKKKNADLRGYGHPLKLSQLTDAQRFNENKKKNNTKPGKQL